MDRTELAWAAGFWDGEGSAYLTKEAGRRTHQPHARVNQSSTTGVPEVLVRFRRVVGFGDVRGPDISAGREPLYRWEIANRSEVERLRDLLAPWLGSVKRRQFAETIGESAVGALDWTAMRRSERRAWAAGLWDGEGSMCLLKHRSHAGHFVPEAAVTQSSESGVPEVLSRVSSIGPKGWMYGPFKQPLPWMPVYRWKLFRLGEIKALIDLMRPWLGPVKMEQASRVFETLEAQPKLPRGNPAWGAYKTYCVNGHEYETARVRPYKARKPGGSQRRPSKQCLACVREYARKKRREGK